MKFIIRDDDPCYFTQVEELEKCYSNINEAIPICFSITPFRIAGKYFDTSLPRNVEMPIHKNTELVNYLIAGKNKGRFDFAIHGYNHIYQNDTSQAERTPEYGMNHGLFKKTQDAKKYLESTLDCSLLTFVPPSNKISKHGIAAICDSDLNLVCSGAFQRPFNTKNITNYFKSKYWRIKNKTGYPFILDYKNYKELHSQLLYPSTILSDLIHQLNIVRENDGIFVLATHYHAFDKKIKSGQTIGNAFHQIIDIASGFSNIEFVSYKNIW